MHPGIEIQQHDNPSVEDVAYISKQFMAYNAQQCGDFPSKDIHLFAYAPDQEIIGGLAGAIFWGWLHVDTLWVDESFRMDGIGTSLMDGAEAEAIAMGVKQFYLETTDFQAVGFYEKRGYQIFAQLENQSPGHSCYYMKKLMVNEQ